MDSGCDAVELDVRRTGDGVLVVHHAARRGEPLTHLTYAELVRRSRHVPPRLEDVVDLCARRVALDVELKEEGTEPAAVHLLRERVPLDRLLVTSFHDSVISNVKRLEGELRCGLLVGPAALQAILRRPLEHPLARAARCGADAILPHQLLLATHSARRRRWAERGLVAAAWASGLPLIVWTVNSMRRMERFLDDGRVAGIITDLPDVAGALRRSPSRASPDPSRFPLW